LEATPDEAETQAAYQKIEMMGEAPEKISVLYGHPKSPYLRIDPYFMPRVDNPQAQEALDALIQELDRSVQDVVLQSGDYCFIDNFKAVHGRKPFTAEYDGNDRWLARINIAKDLRKSRSARASSRSRMIL